MRASKNSITLEWRSSSVLHWYCRLMERAYSSRDSKQGTISADTKWRASATMAICSMKRSRRGPFHQLGRHVLAVGGLHQLLEALGEVDVALVIQLACIAGAQEAILGHHLGGGLRLVVVAAHHGGGAHQQFVVLTEFHLDAAERRAD